MKKIILVGMTLMLAIFITACNGNSIQQNNDSGDLNTMDNNEFEVRIIQHNDVWNENYLNNLSFITITFNN